MTRKAHTQPVFRFPDISSERLQEDLAYLTLLDRPEPWQIKLIEMLDDELTGRRITKIKTLYRHALTEEGIDLDEGDPQ